MGLTSIVGGGSVPMLLQGRKLGNFAQVPTSNILKMKKTIALDSLILSWSK
jgi:hypothetical protein